MSLKGMLGPPSVPTEVRECVPDHPSIRPSHPPTPTPGPTLGGLQQEKYLVLGSERRKWRTHLLGPNGGPK